MLRHALLVFGRIDLPDFFQANAEFAGLAILVEIEFRQQLLGETASRALSKKRILAEQFHAARKRILTLAVAADTHVARRDAAHSAVVVIQCLDRGKTR